jgi:hypothetical protein
MMTRNCSQITNGNPDQQFASYTNGYSCPGSKTIYKNTEDIVRFNESNYARVEDLNRKGYTFTQFITSERSRELITAVALKLKMPENQLFYVKYGVTWAHHTLANAYAQFQSPSFHALTLLWIDEWKQNNTDSDSEEKYVEGLLGRNTYQSQTPSIFRDYTWQTAFKMSDSKDNRYVMKNEPTVVGKSSVCVICYTDDWVSGIGRCMNAKIQFNCEDVTLGVINLGGSNEERHIRAVIEKCNCKIVQFN